MKSGWRANRDRENAKRVRGEALGREYKRSYNRVIDPVIRSWHLVMLTVIIKMYGRARNAAFRGDKQRSGLRISLTARQNYGKSIWIK